MRVFIGHDSRFPEVSQVLAYTMRKHASISLDIRFLDYRHLHECYGFTRVPDPTASTEFSYSRFLIPWLCDYAGTALFVDNDMLCLADLRALSGLPMGDLALRVIKHDYQPTATTKFGSSGTPQAAYPRKNWSSVMLMDCKRLCSWTKERVENAPGAYLHRFESLGSDSIGDLPPGWNDLTHLKTDPPTKMLHYTEGGPWFAGMEDCPHADVWRYAREQWLKAGGHDPELNRIRPVRL